MNRRELVAAVAAHTDQDPKAVDQTLRGFVDVVSATIKKGDPVVMSGFAKWAKVKRAARVARNPQTGEPVKVKASQKVRITPLKALKDVASGAAPAPKLTKAPAKKATAAASRRTRTAAADEAAGTAGTTVKRAAKKAAAAKAPAKRTSTRATASKATASKATGGRAAGTKAAGTKAAGTKATTKRAATKRTTRT